ncbi:MAG: hypothetical protein CSA22_00990 [Deltaproteobacteria bacterium]|nr:MAG: hypothetical protein CSA22_00990 [Deltaproteobacteria bacterium]
MMMNKDQVIECIATGAFSGYAPVAPGTAGSLVGIPIWALFTWTLGPFYAAAVAGLIILAIWSADEMALQMDMKDPGCVVIDEIAGMVITLSGISFSVSGVVIGFLLFRVFDVFKPFPAGFLEKRFSGGTGIVLDDIAAGIMANLTLHLILLF